MQKLGVQKLFHRYSVESHLDCPFLPEARCFIFVQISRLVNKGMQQIPPITATHFEIVQSQ